MISTVNTFVDPIGQLLGSWATTLTDGSILLRLLLAFVFGAIIGCERATKRHSAGLRTFTVVAVSAATASLIDASLFDSGFHVLSAAVVIAIAVLSVNSILFSSRSQIKGLTTSVTLWGVSILGIACGLGLYTLSIIVFIVFLFSLISMSHLEKALKDRSNHFEIHLELKSPSSLQDFVATIRKLGLYIDDIELNPAYANSGLSVYSVAITIQSNELKEYKTHSEIIKALETLDYVYHIEEMGA